MIKKADFFLSEILRQQKLNKTNLSREKYNINQRNKPTLRFKKPFFC